MSYLQSSKNHIKYLWLLYQYDVLSVQHIAFFLNLNPSTCQKYLSALKAARYVTSLRVGNVHYWHILPKGMNRLAEILQIELRSKTTTLKQNADHKHNLKHDVFCSNAIMHMIKTSTNGEYGLFDWYGPTQTRTLYAYQREGESFWRPEYHPDSVIGFYGHNKWAFVDIELDSGSQNSMDWHNKAIKAQSRFNINDRYGTEYRIVAFITLRSEKRKWNIVNHLQAFYDHTNPLLVVATTYKELLECGVNSPIWVTNRGEDDSYCLSELVMRQWEYENSPLLIGTEEWRESFYQGDLFVED